MPKRLNLGSKFLKAELLAMTPINGEFYFATDTNELFFCDDDELKLINAGGSAPAVPAPVVIDLADLVRVGDSFDLSAVELNGKHIVLSNTTPLVPETPEAPFYIRVNTLMDEVRLYHPISFTVTTEGPLNGNYGFEFSANLTGDSTIVYEYLVNGSPAEGMALLEELTPSKLAKIEIIGQTMFVTYVEQQAV